ncbi:hypothetical protein FB562_0080 [Homoserinimonas aerilata]|uniref:DNA modification methylase n=1 Tax=Homoserinimonas aerilata TaxID=1162970 RepID=A0A542YG40_9MICO|nr:hypothetical protein [Homoserinimonas aerilata]TQL47037.1 hypothetical protein FB562_0080 [Homoserinimonas aerilata]
MRARIVASTSLAAVVMLTAAGCGFIAPQATTEHYDPSDGTSATIASVKVLNAIVLSNDGETGNLIASVANIGNDRVTVTLQYEGDGQKIDKKVSVAGNTVKSIGTDEQFLLDGIDAKPGSLMPVFVQYDDETGKQMLVPVLDGTLPEYTQYLP